MKNRFFSAFCLVLMCLAIAGCSQGEDINETTVSIDNKGVITHSIIESFDKDYYNEDELRGIISDEVESYCRDRDKDCAKLESLEIKDGMASARMRFATYSDYAGFNDVDFFYGTVEEAMEHDYPTDVTLKSRDDNSTIGRFEFESLKSSRIIIVSEPVVIHTPRKIAYTTANIDLIDDNNARMASDSVGVGYIVLK
ncbi:MAG: hypothetical protein IK111_02775 [Lachnospiraceae bacterium]|nr:hypothetical protein [Lachnospiraceae bacterium]